MVAKGSSSADNSGNRRKKDKDRHTHKKIKAQSCSERHTRRWCWIQVSDTQGSASGYSRLHSTCLLLRLLLLPSPSPCTSLFSCPPSYLPLCGLLISTIIPGTSSSSSSFRLQLRSDRQRQDLCHCRASEQLHASARTHSHTHTTHTLRSPLSDPHSNSTAASLGSAHLPPARRLIFQPEVKREQQLLPPLEIFTSRTCVCARAMLLQGHLCFHFMQQFFILFCQTKLFTQTGALVFSFSAKFAPWWLAATFIQNKSKRAVFKMNVENVSALKDVPPICQEALS